MSNKNQDMILEQDINKPWSVIANSSRFNITASRSSAMEIGHNNPIAENIGKLLTVMGEQDNTGPSKSHRYHESIQNPSE